MAYTKIMSCFVMVWFVVVVISIIVVQPSYANLQDNLIGGSDFEKLKILEYDKNRFGLFGSDQLKWIINWNGESWQEETLFVQASSTASKITFLASGTDRLHLDDIALSKTSLGKNSNEFALDLIPQKRAITNEQDAPFLLEINPISLDSTSAAATPMIQLDVVYEQNDFKEISVNPDSGIPPFKSVILVHPAQTSGIKNFTILSQDSLDNNVQVVGTVEIQEPKNTFLWNLIIGILTILLALGLFKVIKK